MPIRSLVRIDATSRRAEEDSEVAEESNAVAAEFGEEDTAIFSGGEAEDGPRRDVRRPTRQEIAKTPFGKSQPSDNGAFPFAICVRSFLPSCVRIFVR